MESLLKDIQGAVQKYANIISQILHVEVEIVDEHLVRIAGTGKYENKINKDMSKEGYVYRTVMKSGNSQVIYEPGKDKLCIPCPKRNICEEKFEMSTVLKLKGKIIGIIGLICFNNDQKEHLLSNFNVYMDFLQQISEFISITAYDKMEKNKTEAIVKLLNIVINRIEQAVIILNKDNHITHINENGLKQLKISKNIINSKVNIKASGDNVFDLQEYKLTIEDKVFYIIGSVYLIELHLEQYDKILFFHDVKNFKEKISNFVVQNKVINSKDILGESNEILKLKQSAKKIATANSTVLITGESGTGKEMFARAIHDESNRRDRPFVPINCGAIPDALLESELFGYVKGAFTGADPMGRIGKFELANKGTIFLDEIGDMPMYLQPKILRFLQERNITRIGSNKTIGIDVRVIAATNRNLVKMIKENKFREDLYYRLNVIPLEIPPLRDRIEDIKILVNFFIMKYVNFFNKKFIKIKIFDEVWDCFYNYKWPGNVRELESTIEFIINMLGADGNITKAILPQSILLSSKNDVIEREDEIYTLKEIEKKAIKQALNKYGLTTEGKKAAAKKLGIGIATLYRKIDEYKLS